MHKWTPDYPLHVNERNLMLTDHAVERMAERQLSRRQIAQVIRRGTFEWDYDHIIRYGFPRRLLSRRRVRWANRKRLADLVVLVDARNGWIVTVYREDDPDQYYANLFPRDVRPPEAGWQGVRES